MSTVISAADPTFRVPNSADAAAVRQTALDYVEGWYEANGDRMQRALHPELAKRIVRKDSKTGKDYLDTTLSAELLVQWTSEGGGCLNSSWDSRPNCIKTPKESQRKDITIFDIFENQASAKVEFFEWLDYLHLAKLDGKWVIVNVLWQMKPQAS
jgi:Putative lumazine-binding